MKNEVESGKKLVLDIANLDLTLVECREVPGLPKVTIEYSPRDNITISKVVEDRHFVWEKKKCKLVSLKVSYFYKLPDLIVLSYSKVGRSNKSHDPVYEYYVKTYVNDWAEIEHETYLKALERDYGQYKGPIRMDINNRKKREDSLAKILEMLRGQ